MSRPQGAKHGLMAVFGDTLRQARAYKGATLKEAEQATRINRHHLAALEEEQFDGLPALIYQRGIVRNYAAYLELDPNKLMSMFEEARGASPDESSVVMSLKPLDMPSHWAPNFAIIAFLVVMSAIVFAWLYSAYFAPAEVASTPTEFIATVTPVQKDALYIPSPTVAPPTRTPTATPKPTAAVPTATWTSAPIQSSSTQPGATVAQPTVADVVQPPTEQPTATASGFYAFKFQALGDVTLTVVADGQVVFDGALASGDSTSFFSGDKFQISTSDPSLTGIVKRDGSTFTMGDKVFELP